MAVIRNDPVYRHAWHGDQAMATFLAEQDEALLAKGQTRPCNKNLFSSLEAYRRFQEEQGVDPANAPLPSSLATPTGVVEDMLAAGQRVVVVQPDARIYYALLEHFAAPIAEGRLVLENFAPAPRGGEIAMLIPPDGGRPYHVVTISWDELVAKHCLPAQVLTAAEVPGYPAAPH